MRRPLFLGRIPYRRRRLRDAARLLPVAGAFLMILPILWTPAGGEGNRLLSADVIWFFVTWAALILIAALLAPGLTQPDGQRGDGDGDGEGPEGAPPGAPEGGAPVTGGLSRPAAQSVLAGDEEEG